MVSMTNVGTCTGCSVGGGNNAFIEVITAVREKVMTCSTAACYS